MYLPELKIKNFRQPGAGESIFPLHCSRILTNSDVNKGLRKS